MLRLFITYVLCWFSLFSLAQQADTSIYTVGKSLDFTDLFYLQWEYPNSLQDMLPTKDKNTLVNWEEVLTNLKQNQTRYKSILLPQKEVLASCALMLVLFDQEADSKFYQTKSLYLQLLRERLNSSEKQYLNNCLSYLEQQNSVEQIIQLWQVYFHYTTDGYQALYAAEKLLKKVQTATTLKLENQEDLIATIYYIMGAIYADQGSYTYKKKYYNLCYDLRKKRGDDLCYSLNRILKNTSPNLAQRKVLFKDLLNSIQEYGCRNDKRIFQDAIAYLLKNRTYDLALELFEKGTLKQPCLQDLESLSYGNNCPYFYLGIEALSKGSTFDDVSQDSIAMHWFSKWIAVLDTLALQNNTTPSGYIKFEDQYYLNYTDLACSRAVDFLLYYGKNELAKEFFENHQKPLYLTPNINPNIIYKFNFFYYKLIPHHSIVIDNDLVLLNLKEYLDLSYEVVQGEEKAKIEGLNQEAKRGRECIAWLGQKTRSIATYLKYLEYWMLRTKQLNYLSEEILAHRYYCAALRKDQQYIKALEYAFKLKQLTNHQPKSSVHKYALRVETYFLDNVLNHYEIDSKERKKAMLVVKKYLRKKDKKQALKELKEVAPYKPHYYNYD